MRDNFKLFAAGGLLLGCSLALFVSPWADSDPDALTKVAEREGFGKSEVEHGLDDSPFSGYTVEAIDEDRLSTGVAGLIGVLATFGVMVCVLALVRSVRGRKSEKRKEAP
jgi:hypothetical protein